MSDPLTSAVVSRYLEARAPRPRLAAFVPDKFFKDYEAELKKLFGQSLGRSPLEEAPFLINDRVIPLLKRFIRELTDLAPLARDTLQHRLEMRTAQLEKLQESMVASRRGFEFPHPQASIRDHALLHINVAINGRLERLIPTLGKALRTAIYIDPNKVEALATRAAKKASPEESAAIATDDFNNANLTLKYEFFRKHVDGSIARLIQKSKIETDWLGWFQFIRDVLETNYAKEPTYTEFDLNGMKVVIDDATVTPKEHDLYVKYLDEAYHRLKAKKLDRAWYGTVLIDCQKCGGVNHNTGGGVGGHFNIEKDHVKIFSRPSTFIVELMAHELGHRYWYKSLQSKQRAKFEELVKVRSRPKPKGIQPEILGPEVEKEADKKVEAVIDKMRKALDAFQGSRIKSFTKSLDTFEESLSRAAIEFNQDITVAVQTKAGPEDSSEARKAWDRFLGACSASFKFLFNVREIGRKMNAYPDGPNDWEQIFKKERANWIAEGQDFLDVVQSEAGGYVHAAVEGRNQKQETLESDLVKEWQAEQDAIQKPVLPVSDYGGSNISEAFAEVFAWYVLDQKMNADQEASFKAVLLDKDRTAAQVAARWLRASYRAPCGTR